jgi:hypothetical protein
LPISGLFNHMGRGVLLGHDVLVGRSALLGHGMLFVRARHAVPYTFCVTRSVPSPAARPKLTTAS